MTVTLESIIAKPEHCETCRKAVPADMRWIAIEPGRIIKVFCREWCLTHYYYHVKPELDVRRRQCDSTPSST